MKKRLLSTLLALCMTLSLLPATAWAETQPTVQQATSFTAGPAGDEAVPLADTLTYENLSYTIVDGAITITRCDESATSVIIPEQINGTPVTVIGTYAFFDRYNLISVDIPSSVTSIGAGAFSNCTSLTSIILPSGVSSIGNGAFSGCSELIDVVVDTQNMTYTSENSVLFDKDKHTLIFCPAGKTGEFIIPDSITSIQGEAFSGCNKLTNITIPNSITSIGNGAFSGCSELIDVVVDTQNMTYMSENGVLFDKDKHALIFCPAGKTGEFIIPDSVTSIWYNAFSGCSGLTSITIPNNVTFIGNDVFTACSRLTDVNVDPQNLTYASENGVLFDKEKRTLIFCPDGKVGAYIIPDSVKLIDSYAFAHCNKLTSITIPDSVTSIGHSAFWDCSGLTDIHIPDSVTSIGGGAFTGCSGLTNFNIPNSVASIEPNVFSLCSGLTSITIPSSVTYIGAHAFSHCSSLISITIPDGITSIEDGTFWDCSSLTNITIPESVTYIGDVAFASCIELTSVTIPSSVTCISSSAFPITDIYYQGTKDSWKRIQIIEDNDTVIWWTFDDNIIYCTDGIIPARLVTPIDLICHNIDTNTSNLFIEWTVPGLSRELFQIKIYDIENPLVPIKTMTEDIYMEDVQAYSYSYKVSLEGLPSGMYYLTLQSVKRPEDVLEDVSLYEDSEIVKSIQWTYTVPETPVAPVEPTPPSDLISNKLDSIIDASIETIKETLESIAKSDLKDAVEKTGSSIFDKIDTLESRINGSATVNVDPTLALPGTPKVVGAKLNFDYSTSVRLEIGHPEDDSIQVPEQDNAETFRFSMKLIEGANNNVAELEVPIRVTMPIPAQKLKPHTFKLWHFHAGKLVPVTLSSTPYQDAASGQWYVSFKIDGFSDFIMEYEEETTAPPAVTHTISFDTGGAPLTVPAMTTGADGRLSSLPTPSWSGHRFEGWFLADGSRVTTSTVFSGDTTVRARWSRTASAPETNFVSIPPSGHGKIITADRFAAEGDRVNLSAHPDKGYALASITVTAAGGKELTLREKSDGKFSFTMPDRQVKVIAEFEKTEK